MFSQTDVEQLLGLAIELTGSGAFHEKLEELGRRLHPMIPHDTLAVFSLADRVAGQPAPSLEFFSAELAQRRQACPLDYADFAAQDPKLQAVCTPWIASSLSRFLPCDEFDRHPYVAEFLAGSGVRYEAGVTVDVADAGLVALGLHREAARGPFRDREIQLLQLLSRPLARVFESEVVRATRHRLHEHPRATRAAGAALVFSAAGELISSDPAAWEILPEGALAELRARAIELARHPTAAATGYRAQHEDGGWVVARLVRAPRGSEGIEVLCSLASLRAQTEAWFELQAARYGLTSRQKQVAAAAIAGLSNAEIARKLDVSQSTVKWHLAAVLRKTSLHSRTELAPLLLEGLLPPWRQR